MLAGVADCRRSRKWAAKEDGNWDLNLGPAAIGKKRPCGSEGEKERPRGSKVVGGGPQGFGGEGGDHAAPK